MFRSGTQRYIFLAVTEAKLSTGVTCVQDMFYVMQVQSLELKVKLPILLEINNIGEEDLANNLSVGKQARCIDSKQYFLWE